MTIPAYITREYVRAHPEYKFVYSTNVFRTSTLGQASQCEREPNAFGIPVRFRFCKSNPSSYFHDTQIDMLKEIIRKAIADIPNDPRPTIVLSRIGCGASRMREYAPKTWEWMNEQLAAICWPDITWDYNV